MSKFKILGLIISIKSRIITVIALIGLVMVITNIFNLQGIGLLIFIIALIYEIVVYYAYMLLNLETRKAVYELNVKCDPNEFLARINNMATYIKSPKNFKNWILLNKTAGLIEIGSYDESINLLKQISENELGYIYRVVYYNNMACCYINKFLFQESEKSFIKLAEDNLNKLLNLINDKKMNKKYLEISQKIYKSNKIYIDMCKGNYEICIEQFKEYYPKMQVLKDKNHYKFAIGYCYYMSNNKLQSKEYFEYVINNGNRLYVVQEAKKYMEKIN